MSRIAIIEYHDSAQPQVITHKNAATDAEILGYIQSSYKTSLHRIKCVKICTIASEYSNVNPIENWLKVTQRLKA